MARKKNIEQTEETAMEEKILTFLSLRTVIKALVEEKEELDKAIRSYIKTNPKGKSPEGYLFWEGKTAGALLQDNPLHKTSIDGLIAKIGLVEASKFLIVNRTSLLNAIKAEVISLTLEQLKEITETSQGEKKVLPYYGVRDIRKGGVAG